jgi:DNA polymerase-3 subunit alpha
VLWKHFPIERQNDVLVSAFTEGGRSRELGVVGGIKFDVLGLNTLRIHQECIEIVAARHNLAPAELHRMIDSSLIDDSDPEVFKRVFHNEDTIDIFQFESATARTLLRRIKPEDVNELSTINALNRPGPLIAGYDQEYINVKAGLQPRECIHPIVDQFLDNTHGTLVFQEQIMQICRSLGDLTDGETDLVRKVGFKMNTVKGFDTKDKRQKMLFEIKQKIFAGAISKGVTPDAIQRLWDKIQGFLDYAFNASHSLSYAFVAYISAYLKCKFPIEWHCAYLNGVSHNVDKTAEYVTYLTQKGIRIIPPNIKHPVTLFAAPIDDSTLMLGTAIMKNVGADVPRFMEQYQKRIASFVDFFCYSVSDPDTNINKRAIEALIKGGFFETFPTVADVSLSREQLLVFFLRLNEMRTKFKLKNIAFGPASVLERQAGVISTALAEAQVVELTPQAHFIFEKEILNFSLQVHPLLSYVDQVRDIRDKQPSADNLVILGEIIIAENKTTKTHKPYRLVVIKDVETSTNYRIMFWSNLVAKYNPIVGECGIFIISQPDPQFGSCTLRTYINLAL